MTVLSLDKVARRFCGVIAVSDLSFDVKAGAVTGLMGPNGAGKTTAVNLISGVLCPDSGRVSFEGDDITILPAHRRAARGMARTYQNVRLIAGMTVLDQVLAGSYAYRETGFLASALHLPAANARMRTLTQEARALLHRVGLPDRDDVLAETLSYGEQRRVEIARALAARPRLLLLDEPTAGMNVAESTAIGRLVHSLRDDGIAVLMVEHNMKLVADFCDHVVVMQFGRKIAEGSAASCLADPIVQEAYFGRRDAARHRA